MFMSQTVVMMITMVAMVDEPGSLSLTPPICPSASLMFMYQAVVMMVVMIMMLMVNTRRWL